MVMDHAQRLSLQTMITPDLSGRLFVTKSPRTFRKPNKNPRTCSRRGCRLENLLKTWSKHGFKRVLSKIDLMEFGH